MFIPYNCMVTPYKIMLMVKNYPGQHGYSIIISTTTPITTITPTLIATTIPATLPPLSSREEYGIEFPIQNKLINLLNGL